MKKVFLILFLVCTLPLVAQEKAQEKDFFRSNTIGMLLEKISWYRTDEFEYILQRSWQGGTEIRQLLTGDTEIKRWELSYDSAKNIREEKEFRESELYKITKYKPDRSLSEELYYRLDELYRKVEYTYAARNRINQVFTYNGNGDLLYTDTYALSPQGGLRDIKRQWTDQSYQKTALISRDGKLTQETHASDRETMINHFDNRGNLETREVWKGEKLYESISYTYHPDSSSLQGRLEDNFTTGLRTASTYNTQGWLQQDVITKGEEQLAVTDYIYAEDGNLTETREKNSTEGLKLTRYFYKGSAELDYEEQYIRGSLDTKIQYLSEDKYYREHYNRQGEAVIRVYFENDMKYKEEILENGDVVQTRVIE